MNPLTNLKVLKRSNAIPRRGDIFVMQLPNDLFLFGRVIIADAPQPSAPMPGSNLIYIYDRQSKTPTPEPADLRPGRLLIPPVWTNRLGWTKGYFKTIENRPIERFDLLQPHCFCRTLPRTNAPEVFVDENRSPLRQRIDPCGDWALFSYRWIDDKVSEAVGIPIVPPLQSGCSRESRRRFAHMRSVRTQR